MKIAPQTEKLPTSQHLYRFEHNAMATTFRLTVLAQAPETPRDSAQSSFRIVDQLESHLSRFRHGSDVYQINNSTPGVAVKLGPDCWNCLLTAFRVFNASEGYSDVAIGKLIHWYRENPQTDPPENLIDRGGFRNLHLLPDYCAAVRMTEEVEVDLGSIGKGYALDRVAEHLMEDWDISTFMLECGTSSVVFSVQDSIDWFWPASWQHKESPIYTVKMKKGSLSASAAVEKAGHIVNPHTGERLPFDRATWVYSQLAIESDAISTACSIVPERILEKICEEFTGAGVCIPKAGTYHIVSLFPENEH